LLFDRPEADDNAILVHVDLGRGPAEVDAQGRPRTDHLDEFAELARAAGARIVGTLQTRREQPAPRFFVGTGKADELKTLVGEREARLVIFDHDLSPAQERNLEKHLQARVLSRTGLILDIFAQRARTHEGKLQVELAQLEHMSARLVRGWSHLDREKGGIGLRGAGEKQLELDQRLIQGRIAQIRRRLDAVRRTRAQSRRSRQRAELPLVAVVGYTNAGKSTLFNALSASGVFAADQLFATLDPTLRRIEVPGLGPAVIADTVGFVRRLPHKLVEAFKATLEEVVEADLLLHVLDASDPGLDEKRLAVHTVLEEIDALGVPRLEVLNKIDLTDDPVPALQPARGDEPARVRLSAHARSGFDLLEEAIAGALGDAVRVDARLAPGQGRLRAQCYEQGWVEAERTAPDGSPLLALHLPRAAAERLRGAGVLLAWQGATAPATAAPRSEHEEGSVATHHGPP
jgi:GTP-binding protein HflX